MKPLLRKILNTGFARFVGLLIAFAIGVLVSRFFGAEGKGQLTLLLLVPTLVSTYFAFSIEEGFLYYFGLKKISNKIFNFLVLRICLIIFPVFLIVYLSFFFLVDNYDYYFVPQIILIFCLFFAIVFKYSLRGLHEFKSFNKVLLFEPFITLIGVLFIIYYNLDIRNVLWAYIIGYIVLFPYQYFIIIKKQKVITSNLSLKKIFNYSYKVHFFKILNFTENKFDILLIGYFLSTTQVGIYSVSVAVSVIFQSLIQTPISTILLPSLIKSKNELRPKLTRDYFIISSMLALMFIIGLLFFGKFFVVMIYGAEFEASYIPLIILSFGALAKSPSTCINSFFKSCGKPEELYKTSIYSVFVNITLCILMIPKYGIVGASIASSISYFLYSAIMIYKFSNTTKITFLNLIFPTKSDFQNLKKKL